MNILQIIHNSETGGAEIHTRLITKAMAAMGHRITFIYGPGPYTPQFAKLSQFGVECIEMDMRKHPFQSVCRIRKIIKNNRIDLIHSHMHGADLLAMFAKIGMKVIHITTIHCIPQKVRGLVYRAKIVAATFLSYRFMDRIFAVSKAAGEQMRREMLLPAHKIVVVFNSIDFSEMNPDLQRVAEIKAAYRPRPDSRIVLCVGNLYWIKGYTYAIDAMNITRNTHPSLRLVLAGCGEHENLLRQQVSELDLSDRVVFAGFRPDIADWLAAADFYCQPSLVDAMPRALLEAMYTGLPVIVSNIPNLCEAVTNMETGMVVPVKSAAGLAEAYGFLVDNPAAGKSMGAKAREFVVRNCSMDKMAESIMDNVYRMTGRKC
jgi:glycosyltransferase involved in cell wall biosynthesis